MKTPEEILEGKGITSTTKHHNYDYLYSAIIEAMREYAGECMKNGSSWASPDRNLYIIPQP